VNGRNGVMPAHGELLGDNRTKILAAYVYNLGSGD
jgi:cytochrome c oxidase cbb3-type subunit 3